ncbi:MAG: hypothetical protein PHE51_11370 [Eubacteriales bacterium]|nr:hypothetical protein [Eubacteriales bacterium]
MYDYTYSDFLNTLDETEKIVLNDINEHILTYYPTYKPVDIRPNNKSHNEWTLNYRK